MNLHELVEENKRLKDELQFYKRLTAAIPFNYIYNDYHLKKTAIKNEVQNEFTVAPIIDEKNDTQSSEYSFELMQPTSLLFQHIEKLLEPIFDLIPSHIVITDQHGVITFCNEQAASDLGVVKAKTKGMHIKDLLGIPEDQIILLQAIKQDKVIIKREVLDQNYGIASNHIIRNEDGSISRVIGTFHFLNHLKESEKLSLIGKIAAGIAHEVRNPLTTVRGYLQYLMESSDKTVAETFKNVLIPEIDRANRIITDFLMLSKPSDLKVEEVEINSFLKYFYELIYSDALIHSCHLTLHIDENLNNIKVKIDRNQLLQVLLNLFRNAVEAKGLYPLMIAISCYRKGNYISIDFSDDGPGIGKENKDKIFDPFFTTKEMGTGLGLSVSRKIIENHDGYLVVSSLPGEKTTFTTQLPIYRTTE